MKCMPRGHRASFVPNPLRLLVMGGLLSLLALPLFAEVSVVTDGHGHYLRTLVLARHQGQHSLYWTPVRRGVDPSRLLNPNGDRMGDSRPFVLEQPGTKAPWVVWSAGDGHDKEIAYATWSGGRWQGPQLVEKVDNTYDDLDPRLAFDSAGNPVVVWWRKEPVARIYLSRYLQGEWTPAAAISDPSFPSRFPSVIVRGAEAVVSFYTPRGLTVLFVPLPNRQAVTPNGDGPLDGPVPPPDQSPNAGGGSGPSKVPGGGIQPGDPMQPHGQ